MILDAADSIMNITGGLAINGTYAHIYIHNFTGLQLNWDLDLEAPNGTTVLTVSIDSTGLAFMEDADLALNGTWKVKNDAGSTVTQFDVLIWDGTAADIENDLVTLFSDTDDFLDDYGVAFPAVALPFQAAVSEGELTANGNTNTVDADFIRQDITPQPCPPGGTPGVPQCQGVWAQSISATSISTGLVTGDLVARTILVQPADPTAQFRSAACASIRFEPPRIQDPFWDDTQCVTSVEIDRDYHVTYNIRGAFAPLGLLNEDPDEGWFHVDWAS